MTADEQKSQNIVTIFRSIEPLHERCLGIFEIGDCLVCRQRTVAAPAPRTIECRVAADQNEPAGGIARRSVPLPVTERPETSLLESFLGCVEITEIAQQSANRLRSRRGQCRVHPGA